MTDSYAINGLTLVVALTAVALSWRGIQELLLWIGFPGAFASLVGFAAGVGAFFAVLYGYYRLFLDDEAGGEPAPGHVGQPRAAPDGSPSRGATDAGADELADRYLLNTLTFLVGLTASGLAWSGVTVLATTIGLPPAFAALLGFVAGLGAFLVVLYGYYRLFVQDDRTTENRGSGPGDGASGRDVGGVGSYRK